MRRSPPVFYLLAAVYALLLLVSCSLLPLHLDEILQAAAFEHFSFQSMFEWIAKTPGGGPLSYIVQLPFALLSHSRFVLRFPSICFALGSCLIFFQLARLIPLRRSFLALMVFLAMPVHYYFAAQVRPFEQGVFLLLWAALLFFRLVETPTRQNALWYGLVLTACVFTAPASFMPAVGYALFLLRFRERQIGAPRLVVRPPAQPLRRFCSSRPTTPGPTRKPTASGSPASPYPGGDWSVWTGAALAVLLLIGLIGGAWSTFPSWRRIMASSMMLVPVIPGLQRKRLVVFCLSGGAVAALIPAAVAAFAAANVTAFTPNEFFMGCAGFWCWFSCAGLERLSTLLPPPILAVLSPVPRALASVLSLLLFVLCLPADALYLLEPPGELGRSHRRHRA